MKRSLSIFLALLVTLGAADAVTAKPGKKKAGNPAYRQQNPQYYRETGNEKEPWLKVQISIPEKGILLRHADNIIALPPAQPPTDQRLPPGLAKNVARGKRLPPGWQKKLARGRVFPDNLYQQSTPLPPYILYELPPQPEGTILVAIGGKVVRLLEATKTIADIFDLKL